jgi:hypothetical protein
MPTRGFVRFWKGGDSMSGDLEKKGSDIRGNVAGERIRTYIEGRFLAHINEQEIRQQVGRVPPVNWKPVGVDRKSSRVVWHPTPHAIPADALTRQGLIPYTQKLNRHRRLLAETVLGYLILLEDNYHFVKAGVEKVSNGIQAWWTLVKLEAIKSEKKAKDLFDTANKRLYDTKSFGYLEKMESKESDEETIDSWTKTMMSGKGLAEIMALHNFFEGVLKNQVKEDQANKRPLQGPPQLYQYWCGKLRPDNEGEWLHEESRGRTESTSGKKQDAIRKKTDVSTQPGLLPKNLSEFDFKVDPCLTRLNLNLANMQLKARLRARDYIHYDRERMAWKYGTGLVDYNLPYVAGPSGTTATLLASAFAFGLQPRTDEYRQYLLACIGFLVGGGMHSCHEAFVTASLAGAVILAGRQPLFYAGGKYSRMMPNAFRRSKIYDDWAVEFWDVASPGGASPYAYGPDENPDM